MCRGFKSHLRHHAKTLKNKGFYSISGGLPVSGENVQKSPICAHKRRDRLHIECTCRGALNKVQYRLRATCSGKSEAPRPAGNSLRKNLRDARANIPCYLPTSRRLKVSRSSLCRHPPTRSEKLKLSRGSWGAMDGPKSYRSRWRYGVPCVSIPQERAELAWLIAESEAKHAR